MSYLKWDKDSQSWKASIFNAFKVYLKALECTENEVQNIFNVSLIKGDVMNRLILFEQLFNANQRIKILNDEVKSIQEELCFLEIEETRTPVNIQKSAFFNNQLFLVEKRLENQQNLVKRIRFVLHKTELNHQLKVVLEEITAEAKATRKEHTEAIVNLIQKSFPRNN